MAIQRAGDALGKGGIHAGEESDGGGGGRGKIGPLAGPKRRGVAPPKAERTEFN